MVTKPDLQLVRPTPVNSLDFFIQEFLNAKAGKAQKTVEFYRSVLHLFRDFSGPYCWPPTPEAIDAFLNDAKQRGLKETTLNDYYIALRIWLTWLHKRGKLETNPIALAERPPRPKPLPRAPRREPLQKFFAYLETVADKGRGHWLDVRSLALWSLALDTGLRVGELAALKIADVTIEKKRRSLFIPGRKTHRDRIVVFHKTTGKDISRWLKVRAKLALPRNLNALFVSEHHGNWGALTESGMRQDLEERCLKLGLPHLTPNQFRNAYAVYAIRNRADLLDVQKQMGHTSITTTARYTLVDDEGRQGRHNKKSPRGKL
jgi:integrase/recombinase XerC